MYINTFKYTPEDVDCRYCTEYIKKLGCIASSSQAPYPSLPRKRESSLIPLLLLSPRSAALRGPQYCPCLAERMEAGTVGYEEAVAEILPAGSVLIPRVLRLTQAFPGTMWQDGQHRLRMSAVRAMLGYRSKRDTPRFLAALYLLTANRDISMRTFNCFFRSGIDFRYARRRGISEQDYTLLMAAKSLYCGTSEVTQADLADKNIIDDEALRLIVNALLIVRFGADALKITQRRGQYKYHMARKIRRGTGLHTPFGEVFSPLETR